MDGWMDDLNLLGVKIAVILTKQDMQGVRGEVATPTERKMNRKQICYIKMFFQFKKGRKRLKKYIEERANFY